MVHGCVGYEEQNHIFCVRLWANLPGMIFGTSDADRGSVMACIQLPTGKTFIGHITRNGGFRWFYGKIMGIYGDTLW